MSNDQPAKKILITGATSGIGKAVAIELAGHGHQLALCGRSSEKLNDVIAACNAACKVHDTFDVTAPGAAADFINQAAATLDGLDVVIHCAGVGLIKTVADTTDGEFTRVTNINMRGTFLVAQAASKVFAEAKAGLFITFPGILGRAVMKNAAAYIASKFAVTGMMRAMAQEYQRQNVKYSLFFLGGVDSPFWDDLAMNPQRDKMLPLEQVVELVVQTLNLPSHLVLNEVVLQPESHQM